MSKYLDNYDGRSHILVYHNINYSVIRYQLSDIAIKEIKELPLALNRHYYIAPKSAKSLFEHWGTRVLIDNHGVVYRPIWSKIKFTKDKVLVSCRPDIDTIILNNGCGITFNAHSSAPVFKAAQKQIDNEEQGFTEI